MKSKIIATSVIVLVLVSYVFAGEIDCHQTLSLPCHAAAYTPPPPNSGLGCINEAGYYETAGNSIDQCVWMSPATGVNGCKNEAQTKCNYVSFFILCHGGIWGYTEWSADVTPTQTDGDCK
jgi:hypothetical protein